MNRQTALWIAAVLVAALVGVGVGFGYDRYVVLQGTPPTEPADARDTFGIFWQAWRVVEEHYVDASVATPINLTRGAISGMVDALGDTGHSRYLTPSDRQAEADNLAGKLDGIGIEVEVKDGHITVVAPLDNSPAQKAGILPGDVIEKVNGQDVSRMGLDEVSQIIRGPAGSSVQVTILRQGVSELLDFTMTRQEVTVPDVTWATIPGHQIAHVRISSFGKDTDTQLRAALTDARNAGDTKVILDLRNDPGGLLDQAVDVASEFVASGNVLQTQDRSGKRDPIAVKPGGVDTGNSLVVLVNHGTASAAEIVAGAIQDQHRATIIGEQTFGTGTVLTEYPLSDGSSILLGTSEWLTPSGHSIRNNGITPDQVVPEPVSTIPLVPTEERSLSAEQLNQSNDAQLLNAIKSVGS